MNTTKIYDLPCFDSRKSFYGKAKVIETEVGGVHWWRKQPVNEISIFLNTAIIENARRA